MPAMSEHTAEKDALRSIWRDLAEKRIEHGVDWPGVVRDLFNDLDRAETKLAATWDVLDRANALNPADFKTGQSHLPPAFREVDFKEAFRTVLDLVNDIEQASGYASRVLPPGEGRP